MGGASHWPVDRFGVPTLHAGKAKHLPVDGSNCGVGAVHIGWKWHLY
jgi:hypothetical protein